MWVVRTTPPAILWASMQQHQTIISINVSTVSTTVDALSDVFLHFIIDIFLGTDSGLHARLIFSMTKSFPIGTFGLFQVRTVPR